MIKVRIQFSRNDSLKFLSHLDQQRLFGRALRRAKLPLAFSQGFHPHPIISFANAMSVGMTSSCEYVDVGLDLEDPSEISGETIKKRLKKSLPKGIKILGVEVLPKDTRSLTRLIESADYRVRCIGLHVSDFTQFCENLKNYESKDSVVIKKRNKKGVEVEKEIRNCFDTISAQKDGLDVLFNIRVLPESGSLISPELIIKNFLNSINYYDKGLVLEIHREKLSLKEIHDQPHNGSQKTAQVDDGVELLSHEVQE